MSKQRKWQFLLMAVALLAVAYFLTRPDNLERLQKLLSITPALVAAILGANLVSRALIGIRIRLVMGALGVRLGFLESFGLQAIQGFWNYFPLGGLVGVGVYLKKKHGLPYGRALAAFAIGGMICFSAAGVVGLLALPFSPFDFGKAKLPLTLTFALFALAPWAVVLFSRKEYFAKKFPRLRTFIDGWHLLQKSPWTIARLVLMDCVLMVMISVRLFAAFLTIDALANFWKVLPLGPAQQILTPINVTPANLGVRELIMGAASQPFGFDFKFVLTATVLDSAGLLLLLAVLGPFFSWFLAMKKLHPEQVQESDLTNSSAENK